jgi:hypothetical protein
MAFAALKHRPGVVRNGTPSGSQGFYYDSDKVRGYDGAIGPVGGWAQRTTTQTAMSGAARRLTVWKANDGTRFIGVGTHSNLYAQAQGASDVVDITPTAFVEGIEDATVNTGYGGGTYGVGSYGTPRPDDGLGTPATVWDLDTWGENLVGCCESDGRLFEWALDSGTPAEVISNAPVDCRGLVVTAERFLFALGAGGNARNVAWSDQEDNTTWSAASTNQAGDQDLQTSGVLVTGRRVPGRTLLFTTTDVWQAVYQGPPFIYGFEQVGDGCGLAAKGAVAVTADGRAVWMGRRGFFVFSGYVQPLECPVADYVFSRINQAQITKSHAVHLANFKEVWFFYPSSGTEIDSYVTWNYGDNSWWIGSLVRLCGSDTNGILQYPVMVGDDGLIYDHERGYAYGGATPYAETGPLKIATGENLMLIRGYIPDEKTEGEAELTLYGRMWPNDSDTSSGPHTAASPTDFFLTARQVRARYSFTAGAASRVGMEPMLDLVPAGRR